MFIQPTWYRTEIYTNRSEKILTFDKVLETNDCTN